MAYGLTENLRIFREKVPPMRQAARRLGFHSAPSACGLTENLRIFREKAPPMRQAARRLGLHSAPPLAGRHCIPTKGKNPTHRSPDFFAAKGGG